MFCWSLNELSKSTQETKTTMYGARIEGVNFPVKGRRSRVGKPDFYIGSSIFVLLTKNLCCLRYLKGNQVSVEKILKCVYVCTKLLYRGPLQSPHMEGTLHIQYELHKTPLWRGFHKVPRALHIQWGFTISVGALYIKRGLHTQTYRHTHILEFFLQV